MSEQRAILVSREQRDWFDLAAEVRRYQECAALRDDFDAAGDQPRKRYCEKHGRTADHFYGSWIRGETSEECCSARSEADPCRVVDAIVCVVEP